VLVWQIGTNVPEKPTASAFRVEESSVLNMKAVTSETQMPSYQTTGHHIPKETVNVILYFIFPFPISFFLSSLPLVVSFSITCLRTLLLLSYERK
jgi:ABC-type microcin C transport system permease subunit YejE